MLPVLFGFGLGLIPKCLGYVFHYLLKKRKLKSLIEHHYNFYINPVRESIEKELSEDDHALLFDYEVFNEIEATLEDKLQELNITLDKVAPHSLYAYEHTKLIRFTIKELEKIKKHAIVPHVPNITGKNIDKEKADRYRERLLDCKSQTSYYKSLAQHAIKT